jgi:hypothetical protein
MASDDCHGSGQPGGDRPEHGKQPALPPGRRGVTRFLVLELILGDGEPLSGTVGPPGRAPLAFHGWIDLMSAIHALRSESRTRDRPASD